MLLWQVSRFHKAQPILSHTGLQLKSHSFVAENMKGKVDWTWAVQYVNCFGSEANFCKFMWILREQIVVRFFFLSFKKYFTPGDIHKTVLSMQEKDINIYYQGALCHTIPTNAPAAGWHNASLAVFTQGTIWQPVSPQILIRFSHLFIITWLKNINYDIIVQYYAYEWNLSVASETKTWLMFEVTVKAFALDVKTAFQWDLLYAPWPALAISISLQLRCAARITECFATAELQTVDRL